MKVLTYAFHGRPFGALILQPSLLSSTWCAAKEKILTIDNLIRCKKVIVNWCFMCFRDGESVVLVYSLSGCEGALGYNACMVEYVVAFSKLGGRSDSSMV